VGTGGRLPRVALVLGVTLLVLLVVTDVLTESEALTATFVVPVFLVALAGSTLAVAGLGAAALVAAIASPAWTEGGDAGSYAIRVGAVLIGTVFALFAARQRQASVLAREEVSAALGNLADAVTVQDSSGNLVYANRAAAELLGASSPEELIATPPAELMNRFESFTEDGAPLNPEQLPGRRVLRGEVAEPLPVRAIDKTTGEERWRMVKSTAVPGPPGTGYRAINVIEDITETKRSEIAQRLLAEAGEELASSLDFKTTLRQVARMAVPGFADWCAVSIPREDGSLEQVAIAHVDPDRLRFAEEIRERYPTRLEDPGPQMVLRAGKAILLDLTDELIRESAKDEEHYRLIQQVGMRSAIAAPMFSGGELLGLIYFITSETGRRLTEDDLEVAEELARRAKVAVLNARLFEERSSAARTLEQALRPPPLPEIPGWRRATMYEPASAGGLVGGDFYDAFPVGDEWMVVIGDVVGRGVEAAGLTAMARYTLRTAGAMTGDPLAALDHLNRWLLERGDMCTAAVAVLGPGGSVRLCSAGHPPPFVVSDGAVTPWVAQGTMLGAFAETAWELEERVVDPGEHLVLYTDGLFELPGRDGRLGEERLRRTFAGVPDPDQAVKRARAVLHEFAGGSFNDDMALVVLQREA
jgi:PAS domain S-box-containing protein